MKTKLGALLLLALFGAAQACAPTPADQAGSGSVNLQGLGADEALADLDVLGQTIRNEYGALSYKKARYGFDLDSELALARSKIQAGTTEGDRVRPFYELLAKLRDGHVSLSYRLRGDTSAESTLTGLFATPIDGAYYVSAAPAGSGIVFGDKLVSIDGVTTDQLEALLFPLDETGTPEASRHRIGVHMTTRPFYMPAALQPRGPTASVVVEHADGNTFTTSLAWTTTRGITGQAFTPPPPPPGTASEPSILSPQLAYLVDAERRAAAGEPAVDGPVATAQQRAQSTPIWLTKQVRDALGVVDVSPKLETLAALGIDTSSGAPFVPPGIDAGAYYPNRAYKYRWGAKTVLVIRIPTFLVTFGNSDENVAWVAAVLQDNVGFHPGPPPSAVADMTPDVVVIDVSHNPGGSVPYVQGLASLFITRPIANIVQATRASRANILSLSYSLGVTDPAVKAIYQSRYDAMSAAYDRGDELAPFAPMSGENLGPKFPFTGLQAAGDFTVPPHPSVRWSKPILVLHDELSGSGGDAFPTLLQHSGVAKTFGARTAGAGGSVATIQLPYSAAMFGMPHGLFAAYDPDPANIQLVENNGVTPDFPYVVSIYDFRDGYLGYANAFTSVATSLPPH